MRFLKTGIQIYALWIFNITKIKILTDLTTLTIHPNILYIYIYKLKTLLVSFPKIWIEFKIQAVFKNYEQRLQLLTKILYKLL